MSRQFITSWLQQQAMRSLSEDSSVSLNSSGRSLSLDMMASRVRRSSSSSRSTSSSDRMAAEPRLPDRFVQDFLFTQHLHRLQMLLTNSSPFLHLLQPDHDRTTDDERREYSEKHSEGRDSLEELKDFLRLKVAPARIGKRSLVRQKSLPVTLATVTEEEALFRSSAEQTGSEQSGGSRKTRQRLMPSPLPGTISTSDEEEEPRPRRRRHRRIHRRPKKASSPSPSSVASQADMRPLSPLVCVDEASPVLVRDVGVQTWPETPAVGVQTDDVPVSHDLVRLDSDPGDLLRLHAGPHVQTNVHGWLRPQKVGLAKLKEGETEALWDFHTKCSSFNEVMRKTCDDLDSLFNEAEQVFDRICAVDDLTECLVKLNE